VPNEHRTRGNDKGEETVRADITAVFWSDRGEHHNDHGTDMTRKPNRLRSPQQSRRHGPPLEKVGYIKSIFSITPEPHIGSIDMNECAPIWVADSGHHHWHEECGVQRCRRSSASGLLGAINLFPLVEQMEGSSQMVEQLAASPTALAATQ